MHHHFYIKYKKNKVFEAITLEGDTKGLIPKSSMNLEANPSHFNHHAKSAGWTIGFEITQSDRLSLFRFTPVVTALSEAPLFHCSLQTKGNYNLKFSQALNRTDKSCGINAMILFKPSIELIIYFPSNVTNSELKSHTSNHIIITSLFPQPWTKLSHGMSKPRNRSRLFFSLVKAISRVRFFKFSCQGWKLQRVPSWQEKKMPNFAEARLCWFIELGAPRHPRPL